MGKKIRFPDYATIIGEGTEVAGDIRFDGGLHIDGKVTGDVSGISQEGCALTVGGSGTVEGNLDVAYVVIGGTVVGDVRASVRAELAPGARIEGTLYYGVLEMAEGAEVNGKVLHIDAADTPRLMLHYPQQERDRTLDPPPASALWPREAPDDDSDST
jgi:cytoskeletal protein CcmA (bactofilin family)